MPPAAIPSAAKNLPRPVQNLLPPPLPLTLVLALYEAPPVQSIPPQLGGPGLTTGVPVPASSAVMMQKTLHPLNPLNATYPPDPPGGGA